MAEWSKALSLTASGLSPLPWFESRPGHVRQLHGGIRRVLHFPALSRFLADSGEKQLAVNGNVFDHSTIMTGPLLC